LPQPARGETDASLVGVLSLGREELRLRAENARRTLAEHGVTVFNTRNPARSDSPWELDILPVVIDGDEWRAIETGLVQRARLINLLLRDLYGTQRLVRDGLVPAALVFANPAYLRPCQAIAANGGQYLQVYAADLGRSPDGTWWVLADRTQAPSGLGFAMENRSVLWRVLPEAVRALRPRPLADPSILSRETLRWLAPKGVDEPNIALLTPGPRNEAYFEHAYLSRHLGLTLVEGDDLTVRNRRLFVKTLNGLRRVDVVLRRVNDAFCDPLELRPESLLGVAGLVETIRAGHVGMANAIGASLLESPGFMPFLAGICRHLLDEDLVLPSIPTWWCGQSHEQVYVRDHSRDLLIRPAFHLAPWEPTGHPARDLAGTPPEQLLALPHEFVGQEPVLLSPTPALRADGSATSRPFVLRVFVVHDGNEFRVVPGGLARLVDSPSMPSCAWSLGGVTKDVWVLPGQGDSLPPAEGPAVVGQTFTRVAADLPSRTADNFFWLGRYTERLEEVVRTARHALRWLGEENLGYGPAHWEALVRALAGIHLIPPRPAGAVTRDFLQKEILLLLYQAERPGGIRQLLKRIHQSAFAVRDRLSADTWRIVNRLEPDARQRPRSLPLVEASGMLHTLVLDLAAFSGMEMENMTRGSGWAFLDLGRRLERGRFLAKLLEAALGAHESGEHLLETLLEIADSVMTHRRRYFSEPRLASVLEVLWRDPTNPRSLAFQVAALRSHAAGLPSEANPEGVAALRQRFEHLSAWIEAGVPSDQAPDAARMAAALAGFTRELAEVSELITHVYFSHVTPRVS